MNRETVLQYLLENISHDESKIRSYLDIVKKHNWEGRVEHFENQLKNIQEIGKYVKENLR